MLPDSTDVLIVGGGPAGTLLGCLLARQGVRVTVVEKQTTPERTFRGESIMGQAVDLLHQLGFGPALREHGYYQTHGTALYLEGKFAFEMDFRRFPDGMLPIDIPQPALIKIFEEAGSRYPTFHMAYGTTMTDLYERGGAVAGAILHQSDGTEVLVRSRLVVGADGRYSRVRQAAGLTATITPMNRDALWFKVPRPDGWPQRGETFAHGNRHVVEVPGYGQHLRLAVNVPKRGMAEWRKAGLDSLVDNAASLDPRLGPLMKEHLRSWRDTRLLDVFTAVLPGWARDGLVLVGDASHTCSPIMGQGVNFAIQDCVRIAPVIGAALSDQRHGVVPASAFSDYVAKRRVHKNRVTRIQVMLENSLAAGTPWGIMVRRRRYQVLNSIPFKYKLLPALMSTRGPIDRALVADPATTGMVALP